MTNFVVLKKMLTLKSNVKVFDYYVIKYYQSVITCVYFSKILLSNILKFGLNIYSQQGHIERRVIVGLPLTKEFVYAPVTQLTVIASQGPSFAPLTIYAIDSLVEGEVSGAERIWRHGEVVHLVSMPLISPRPPVYKVPVTKAIVGT